MKLKTLFSWMLVGVLAATFVVLTPSLRADGGPLSGVFTREEPAQPAVAPDAGAAGILPEGTKVEPVAIDHAAIDDTKGDPSGLASEASEVDQPAKVEQPVADPKAAGLEMR